LVVEGGKSENQFWEEANSGGQVEHQHLGIATRR
jgi:hypothetical protein